MLLGRCDVFPPGRQDPRQGWGAATGTAGARPVPRLPPGPRGVEGDLRLGPRRGAPQAPERGGGRGMPGRPSRGACQAKASQSQGGLFWAGGLSEERPGVKAQVWGLGILSESRDGILG